AQLAHMQPDVIVTLGNFATKFLLESPVGITRARGRVYYRNGSAIVPTFHPAAALRGGRFGGLDPVDAIRADLRVAAGELEKAAAPAPEPPAPEPTVSQLGLFG
ncbi:MAG: uracil-DNA glycosylase, partial [Actinomycetota bacterium]|nr:uracil-DNA glycosylase [Actinomycetota bacterium]